jgi:hypothetical protein
MDSEVVGTFLFTFYLLYLVNYSALIDIIFIE